MIQAYLAASKHQHPDSAAQFRTDLEHELMAAVAQAIRQAEEGTPEIRDSARAARLFFEDGPPLAKLLDPSIRAGRSAPANQPRVSVQNAVFNPESGLLEA